MSIKIAGKTIVGPNNPIYIGSNGNFWCGNRDLGVKAKSDVEVLTQIEFDNETRQGLYYVVVPSENGVEEGLSVYMWYIDEFGNKHPISNTNSETIIPVIGPNGNWFIAGEDTGMPSVIATDPKRIILLAEDWTLLNDDIYIINITYTGVIKNSFVDVELDTSFVEEEDIPVVHSNYEMVTTYKVYNNFIRFYAKGLPTVNIPVAISAFNSSVYEGWVNGGVTINDDKIDSTIAWSSHKIHQEIELVADELTKKIEAIEDAKDLEFIWSGTRLGVRQQTKERYLYQDLQGATGLTGADGSSIIAARLDDRGHLLLTIQDNEVNNDTTKIMTLDSAVVTIDDIITMRNNISRINNDISALKTSSFRDVFEIGTVSSDYETIVNCTGVGNVQIFTTRFTGNVRIIVDDIEYESEFTDLTLQSDSNVLAPSYTDNTVLMNSAFAANQAIPLEIKFTQSIVVEIKATRNAMNKYPRILVQGDHYFNSNNDPESGGSSSAPGGGNTGGGTSTGITNLEIEQVYKDVYGNSVEDYPDGDDVSGPITGGGVTVPEITNDEIDQIYEDVYGSDIDDSTGGTTGGSCTCEPSEAITDEEIEAVFTDTSN